MFKKKILTIGAIAALLLTSAPVMAVQAQEPKTPEIVTSLPANPPADVLGYYSNDGGKTWAPIKEQAGVAERIPAGVTKEDFMSRHNLSPQAGKSTVYPVPSPSVGSLSGSQMDSLLVDPPPEYSVFYQDANYTGQYQLAALPSTSIPSLSAYGMNDIFSSVKVSYYAANGATIFEHDTYGGSFHAFDASEVEP